MALSFISNFILNSSPPLPQNRNPDIVSFQQRKKPKFSNLSFSNTYSPSPTPTPLNANPLVIQNDSNSFFSSHPNNYTTSISSTNSHFLPTLHNNNNPFFNSLSSPQTLIPPQDLDNPYPYDNYVSDQFFNSAADLSPELILNGCWSSNPDLIPQVSTYEDEIFFAPLQSEPQICDFPLPVQDNAVYDCGNSNDTAQEIKTTDQLKKSSPSSAITVSPQSIAARERRRKITEKTQELGKLVPGGNKMSTAEMFQAAYKYVKFLQAQVSVLQAIGSSIKEMKQESLYIKELQVLASPVVQQKLYSEEKCLVPKQFLDQFQLANYPEFRPNSF